MTIIVRFVRGPHRAITGVTYFRLNPYKALFYEYVDETGWHSDVLTDSVVAVEVVG